MPGGSFDETNDIASGIVGKEVLVPSDALVALVEKHGSGVFLHGIVKVGGSRDEQNTAE